MDLAKIQLLLPFVIRVRTVILSCLGRPYLLDPSLFTLLSDLTLGALYVLLLPPTLESFISLFRWISISLFTTFLIESVGHAACRILNCQDEVFGRTLNA